MALGTHLFSLNVLSQSPYHQSRPFPPAAHFLDTTKTRTLCTNNRIGHSDLASDSSAEVAKINTHLVQKEEAMNKSKELLFTEFCNYLALEKEEGKRKWSKMEQEEKWVLVSGFVNEWGANFHPLSARSVKEMIEEHLHEDKSTSNAHFSVLLPGLRRMMGFS